MHPHLATNGLYTEHELMGMLGLFRILSRWYKLFNEFRQRKSNSGCEKSDQSVVYMSSIFYSSCRILKSN